MLKICKINACPNGTLGLHLSRAPWDPYPWVSGIQEGSSAEEAGMRVGDTVLEFNGSDVLGQKIFEIATRIREHWQSGATDVSVVIWRNDTDTDGSCCSDECEEEGGDDDGDEADQLTDTCNENDEKATKAMERRRSKRKRSYQHQQHSSINQQSLQKFATCLQHIAQLLECPVCLEVIRPPGWQCCNGHVLCNNCRNRSVKCPVCRVPLGPRGRCLLADKLFTVLAESFPCDGVRINRNILQENQKCSPATKEEEERPKGGAKIREQERDKQQQQQHLQMKAKEMQQKKERKVKTAVGGQKNVSNGKVVAQECTAAARGTAMSTGTATAKAGATAINDVQQVNNMTTTADNSNNNNDNDNDERMNCRRNCTKLEGHGSRWQWRKSWTFMNKQEQQQQQQQQQQKSNKLLQVFKRYADEELSNTVSRVMTTMGATTNGSA